jgi:phthiocerol/phenolphthiocerol synthesis type-I polyketide synthase E
VTESRSPGPAPPPNESIAVVGMAGRFPGAPDLDAFWDNLVRGVESIVFFTSEELAAAGVDPELAGRPDYVPAAGLLDGADRFDAELFGYSPREAALLDPQQRLFLETAWAALEDAGLDPRRASGGAAGRTAVFAGAGLNRYLLDHVYPRTGEDDPAGAYQAALGNDKDFLATRVSYKLDLTGPSLTVQTACSTSLVAVALACQSLATGDCDRAVAGGVTLRLPLTGGYLFQEEGILSPDGHCRAFDAGARGTVPGSGVGAVVLERLDDALAAGRPVRAVVRGWAVNNDGAGKAGYTAPRAEGQAAAIAEALALAGVAPATVGYVEAHGTGTRLGDPIEVAALARAFGPGLAPGSVALGSVKTNIGHLDAAAGIAGLIKTVLALERGEIPPSLHFREPNPEIDWTGGPFRVAAERTLWRPAGHPRRAGVSSFGIGGTNAHLVLEEAPAEAAPERREQGPWLFAVSAASREALEHSCARLAAHLRSRPGLDPAAAAHTLLAGRAALGHRRAVVAGSLAEAAGLLAGDSSVRAPGHAAGRLLEGVAGPGETPVAFLFPGQGSQYSGMAGELYRRQPLFRRELDRCAEVLQPHLAAGGGPPNPLALLLADRVPEGRADPLADTALAQPLLFAVEHSLARLWIGWSVEPEVLLGHSVGELVAACLAGVLDLEEALPLVAARGRLVANLPPGAMLAVPLPEDELRRRLEGEPAELALAAVNAPELCAVSGPEPAVAAFAERLAAGGVAARRLHTSHAFHSPAVEPAVAPFRELAARCRLRPPRLPFLSGVTGGWITDQEATDPGYWARQLREPVRFAPAVAELLAGPRRALVEVGPGDALSNLVERQLRSREALRRRAGGAEAEAGRPRALVASLPGARAAASDAETLLAAAGRLWTAGVAAGEGFADLELDAGGGAAPPSRRRVRLPTYPFAGGRHWLEPPPGTRGARAAAPAAAPSAVEGAIAKEPDPADWFYVPSWRRGLPVEALPRRDGDGPGGSWLVLFEGEGGAGLGAAVVAELARRGEAVTAAGPDEAGDLDRLLGTLAEEGRTPARILDLRGLAGAPEGHDPTGAAALVALVCALSQRLHGRPVELAVVTDRLFDLAGEGGRSPESAALAGLARVVPQEHPTIRCRTVDLDLDSGRGTGALEAAAGALVAEIEREGPPLVALRGRHRFEPVHERLRLEAPAAPALDPGGHYLLTGGLGRFALAVARRLVDGSAPAGRPRLTLLDRRSLDDGAGGEAAAVAALIQAGAEVAVVAADVADREATLRAVAEAVERFGPLAGAVHAAGAPSGSYKTLAEVAPEDFRAHLAPKVAGARNLADALEALDRPPPFVLCASSLAPVLGGVGLAPFAAADAALDALAEAFDRERRGGARWRSVDWEGWEALGEGGGIAGTPLGQQQSALMMTPEEVGEAFARAVAVAGPPRLVAATGDLPARIAQWSDVLKRRAAPAGKTAGRPAGAPPYRPPASPLEARVAAIWADLLGVAEIGADDDFFLFGGDSLVGLQVLSRMRSELDVELPLRSFFEARTVAGIAVVVEAERRRGEEEAARMAEILAEIEALSDDEAAAALAGEGEG